MINWKYILIIVILAIFVGVGVFYQRQALKEEVTILETETPEKVTEVPKEEKELIEDETADWNIYRNEKYGYEVKYPENWRLANSVIDWWYGEKLRYPRRKHPPVLEDWVMITNLSDEEEANYLEALNSYWGIGSALNHVENADGRSITITPSTRSIKELKEQEVPGWNVSDFRETKIKTGLIITLFRERITWEMDRDYEVAYIPYPMDEKITYIRLDIERNNGNYEREAFYQILSTFRFLE